MLNYLELRRIKCDCKAACLFSTVFISRTTIPSNFSIFSDVSLSTFASRMVCKCQRNKKMIAQEQTKHGEPKKKICIMGDL